jgi:hypothetical protein
MNNDFWMLMMSMVFTVVITTAVIAMTMPGTSNGFIRMIEARMNITPGQTRVLPDCQCTVRYLGTTVHGTHYTIHLDKLD